MVVVCSAFPFVFFPFRLSSCCWPSPCSGVGVPAMPPRVPVAELPLLAPPPRWALAVPSRSNLGLGAGTGRRAAHRRAGAAAGGVPDAADLPLSFLTPPSGPHSVARTAALARSNIPATAHSKLIWVPWGTGRSFQTIYVCIDRYRGLCSTGHFRLGNRAGLRADTGAQERAGRSDGSARDRD